METADVLRSFITGAILVAYVFIFVQEAARVWSGGDLPAENEARTYIWTGVSALLGSVTALLLGVEVPKNSSLSHIVSPLFWRDLYAYMYVVVGLLAVLTWLVKSQRSSTLIKNTSTTFIGIALPAASGWLLKTLAFG